MVIVLLALIMRGVSFEFRGKMSDPRWRSAFRWTMTIGSALIPFLLGVALGDLLHGLPLNSSQNYTGNFWDLLTPFGLYTGLTMLVLSLLAGATFLALKTTGPVQERSVGLAKPLGLVATAVVIGFVIWTRESSGHGVVPTPTAILAVLAVAAAAWLSSTDRQGWAFAMAAVGIAATVASLFEALFPNVMVSSTNAAYNLTVSNASSNSYALKVMTVVALIFTPLVLLYQGWTYWVFRNRVAAPQSAEVEAATSPSSEDPAAVIKKS
jgi:cytochrome d ubiquinol oxidase subunit II